MAKNKRPELDLITEAQAARVEARAMPQGPGRTAAIELLRCKKTGILRDAADSHGIIYAKRGRFTKTWWGSSTASGAKNMIAERFDIYEQVAEMHSMLAEYHRKLAKEARLDVVHDYHVDLAQRLADEATQIPRRAATLARFHELEKQITRELGRADLTDPAAPLSR
jgi:hypothetical protein